MDKPRVMVMDPSGDRRSAAFSVLRYRRWNATPLPAHAADQIDPDTAIVLAVDDAQGTGLEVLRQVRRSCPAASRILVCAPAVAAKVVARGEPAHQVVVAPATTEKTMAAVKRALRVRALLADPQVGAVAQSMGAVPAQPKMWTALNQLLQSDTATMRDAVALVERDVGLAGRVLHLVNTGMFGLERPIGSLRVAIQRLGLQLVRDLVLSVELMDGLSTLSVPPQIAPLPLQTLSFLVAQAAREVAPRAGVDTAFTAGLFHLLGRLVLIHNAPDLYARVAEQVEAGSDVHDAESNVFGLHARTLSAWLLANWGLPHEVVEAVRWSDEPEHAQGRGAPLAFSVFLASRLVDEAAWESVTGTARYCVSRANLAPWGLSESLEDWRAQVRELVAQGVHTPAPAIRAS